MGTCDLCGAEGELFLVEVEGSRVSACKNCARLGRVIGRSSQGNARVQTTSLYRDPVPEAEQQKYIVAGYGDIIHSEREKRGLSQRDFAMKLTIKESLLQKIEANGFEPSIELAQKLEKLLGIKLVQVFLGDTPQKGSKGASPRSALTIGDILQLKGKKL